MNNVDSGVAEMLHLPAMKGPMHALCRVRSSEATGGAGAGSADRTPPVRAYAAMLWI
jgi:hypothetical protein